MTKFKNVPNQITFPQVEEEVLKFWKENNIFEKSVESRPDSDTYSFYDGPPFITGSPHHGSLLPSIAKDVIPRYWTMKGKKVRRVWGWDCHGLPAENKVEEILGLKSKKDIESIGIKKYIDECYNYVQNVSQEWEWYIDHVGRWVDFKNAYKTMDLKYMETVMWTFAQLYKKDLIYKGNRTSLFCPRCSTPLSNFEIAMDNSYKMVEDPAIFIKFKLKNQDKFIVAWTTTPWTLPGNLALAVNKKETYSEVKYQNEILIVAKSRVENSFADQPFEVIKDIKGSDLVGLEYEPLYDYYAAGPNDYKIYNADFVTMDDGTGIVHIAPGFGEDDSVLGKQIGLSVIDHVDDDGKIIAKVEKFAGLFVKKADPVVITDLKERNLLFKEGKVTHSYPFCYRCATPLIYKTQNAWYLKVQDLKDLMKKTNQNINWVPDHIKNGRFGQGIKSAPDWCLSRSRYWASPIPVWECECGERFVPESISELEQKSGQKIENLHKPGIDEVKITCDKCGKTASRVSEVLDCWFESGSMPYAQLHYPFENKELFEKGYPADYIIEYIGQTRGWFYTLHVISNALFGKESFKNCVVTGVIMGTDGRKMSKLFKNYPDPKMVLEKYGAEAYRLYFMSSVVMLGENINIDEKDIDDRVKNTLLPLWNSFKYFLTYGNLHDWTPSLEKKNSSNILDQWIQNQADQLTTDFAIQLESYNIPNATRLIQPFIDDLSRWYIRQSRDRFVAGDNDALQTLWQVLVQFSKTVAPIIPFISEYFWQNLVIPFDPSIESIHLAFYPTGKTADIKLIEGMNLVQQICEQGNMIRKTNQISTRQPLSKAVINTQNSSILNNQLIEIIKNELNVKSVETTNLGVSGQISKTNLGVSGQISKTNLGVSGQILEVTLDTVISPELQAEGDMRDFIRQVQSLRKEAKLDLKDQIKIKAPVWPKQFENEILTKTLSISIEKSDTLSIEKII